MYCVYCIGSRICKFVPQTRPVVCVCAMYVCVNVYLCVHMVYF